MAVDPDAPEVIEPGVKAERSLSTLLSDLAGETVELFRQELTLFKAELQEKASRAGIGAAALAAAALIAFSGWLFLLLAAAYALAIVVPPWAAALIVGVLVLAIAGVLALIGKSRMRTDALTPERTLRSLREDQAWIKDAFDKRFRRPVPMTGPAGSPDLAATAGRPGRKIKAGVEVENNPSTRSTRRRRARRLVGKGSDMYIISDANESLQHGLDVVRANPIPVALIGLGVAWLISNNTGMTDRVAGTASDMGRRVSDTASRITDIGERYGPPRRRAGHRRGPKSRARELRRPRARAYRHPMVDRDGENSSGWVHQMSDQASGALRSARDTSGALLNRVGSYAGADGVSDMFERNPLIIGAIGLMTGAIIAALVPISHIENELLGETRDEFWQRAEDFGEEAVQRVREAATDAATRAVDAATGAAVESVRQLGDSKSSEG